MVIKKKLKWQKFECHQESIKYLYRNEFKKKSYNAYQAAYRNDWIDEICSHMICVGNEYKRMIYRIIFTNNYCYVGLTSNFERRIYEHLNKKGVVYNFKTEYNLIPKVEKLTNYINVEDAKKQEEYWKNKSEYDGYICLNSAKTGGLGCSSLKWNKEECEKEALKYKNRNDFMLNSHSAYNSARKNKWLNDICSHMIILHKKWKKDECQKEALKYKSRGEFANNNHKIWSFSKKYD
jgi:predicted GIY-YIG superfamily endonuclease